MLNSEVDGSQEAVFAQAIAAPHPKANSTSCPSGAIQEATGCLIQWVRAAQLPDLFCSWDLAYRCTRGGWLKPVLQGRRRTISRLADVLRCLRRIEAGEKPPRRSGRSTG